MTRLFRPAFALISALAFALPAWAEMQIVTLTSPGGIPAWLVQDASIPFTALEIQFRGGTSLDAPGKRGAVNLMSALLEEGAGDLDAQGFAEARDALAADFRFRASRDSIGVTVKVLSDNRDAAMALLQTALVTPGLDPDAVERVRGQVLAGLRSDAKDPDTLASHAFYAAAFGDHPYASAGDGTTESVSALTREDLFAAHRATMARDRLYVSAAGDISVEELGKLIDKLVIGLPATGAPQPGAAPWNLKGGISVTDFPSPQATIVFGQKRLKQADPDYFAAVVLNEILGGGRFSARLMTELREKRGLTYGVGTSLVPMDRAEVLIGQFSASNEKVAEALSVLRTQWARIAAEGVTAKELEATKTYLTGSYPLRFDGNGPIASILVGMQMEGMAPDYVLSRNEMIRAVALEDVRRVAKRLLTPEALAFAVVGQPVGVVTGP